MGTVSIPSMALKKLTTSTNSITSSATGVTIGSIDNTGGSTSVSGAIVDAIYIDDLSGNRFKLHSDTDNELKLVADSTGETVVNDLKDKSLVSNRVVFKHPSGHSSATLHVNGGELTITGNV
tara:strand:+ start:109 stop:474 length:366 start_codon:yes stop_codon:yes gene_type:complete